MLYNEQQLTKGTINKSLQLIHNCKISEPPWTQGDDYSNSFVIDRRDSIVEDANVGGTVVNSRLIGDVNFILVKDNNTYKIKYDSAGTYVQLGTARSITSKTPIALESGISARGVRKETGVNIADVFFAVHTNYDNNSGIITYSNTRIYLKDDIVQDGAIYYVSIAGSIGQPVTSTTHWKVYDSKNSGISTLEPVRNYSDEFAGNYRVLRLQGTGIRNKIALLDYIYFYDDKSGLQGVASEIQYIDSTLWVGGVQNSPDDVVVYIRATNKYGRGPYFNANTSLTEKVAIYSGIGEVPVIATADGLYAYNIIEDNIGAISTAQETKLIALSNIEDLVRFNSSLFILNDQKYYFSSKAGSTDINIHPFDFYEILGGKRLIPFGKMLLLLGSYDKVISPFKDSNGNDNFNPIDLNFQEDLFSKYSAISYMGSLYMIKKNRILVKVDVIITSTEEYSIQTTDVMTDIKGLLDNISGEVYMQINSKEITILNPLGSTTEVYNYNIEYQHWSTQTFANLIYKIEEDIYYGTSIYKVGGTESFVQSIGFVFGTADLFKLKQFIFLKMIFGIKEQQLDYWLDVEWNIGGIKDKVTVALDNYNVNINIANPLGGLGDSMLGTTLLGTEQTKPERTLGNLCTVNVGIGKTASMIRFILRSKVNNGFIYGGSILGYETNLAELTEVGYKH